MAERPTSFENDDGKQNYVQDQLVHQAFLVYAHSGQGPPTLKPAGGTSRQYHADARSNSHHHKGLWDEGDVIPMKEVAYEERQQSRERYDKDHLPGIVR
mmetsp:Transcript_50092/g.107837  ORF Transcript_50092/g.107837 Transcript_50092/m.107837 type:complete len:99 (-) Transcript_50092:153-449(-)